MSAWIAHLRRRDGTHLGEIDVPGGAHCGEDFCDQCLDCLACDEGCSGNSWGDHVWIVYEEQLEEFLADHDGAALKPVAP